MKPIQIKVSKQDLTRCQSCSRHHSIDRTLSSAEMMLLSCDFCGELLIGDQRQSTLQLKTRILGRRSSKLAMGLLGAGLLLSACDDEETVEASAGSTAGMVAGMEAGMAVAGAEIAGISQAGTNVPEPMYGGLPIAGESAGVEVAGTPAGIEQEIYGAPPAGFDEAGSDEAGSDEAGIEMAGTPEAGIEALYGAPPAGDEGE